MAGCGVGFISFVLILLGLRRLPPPERETPDKDAIDQGLAALTPLDRLLWGKRMERFLRNPEDSIWIHVPKDGIVASTLDRVNRLWLLPFWAFFPGLVLVDLHTGIGVVTGIGWFLIGLGVASFFVGVSGLVREHRSRRAFRRAAGTSTDR